MKNTLIYREISRIIKTALKEDIGTGDITTKAIVSPKKMGQAQVIAKDDFVVAGIDIFKQTFLFVDESIKIKIFITEGNTTRKGEVIAQLTGALASILQAERVALNILQRMCGIATQTKRYVEAVRGTKAKILDTRKTIPGLRLLDKMAVKAGGGFNHRMGLYDGALIKDNHIAAAGNIKDAVAAQKKKMTKKIKVEVETKNLTEVEEALNSAVDIIMLDNMSIDEMKKAVALVKGRALVEASGNVNLNNVAQIAQVGVDFISVGEITHSVRAADISLKIIV
ncbi:MAG: nicotinate-nucleotide diphosphorylase (carboxylating) [Deltaproteobacteria bacterium RBG_19FT_COMBO_43_11]|nr:MAG: nicotinate-nucleotide diphosphorylase (carboxylating) [Deltaproteobacteria bacterium RBG_19FT_COMBO_43_11]